MTTTTTTTSQSTPVPHKYADVIKAWADGHEVQYKYTTEEENWKTVHGTSTPNFSGLGLEWRIKPKQHTGWINIYKYNVVSELYPDKTKADMHQDYTRHRIACIQITYTEGEGLESTS